MSKYLLYAIGEILLVVIGILIALQINNWNDRKIMANKEKAILIEMKTNLESDLEGLQWDISKNERLLSANLIVLENLNKGVYSDSLARYYSQIKGNTVFVKNTSAFENLQSLGLNIIKNDSLRIKITQLYSEQYDYIRYVQLVRDEKFQYDQIIPQINKHLSRNEEGIFKPINYPELVKDNEFKSVLEFNCELRGHIISIYRGIEEDIIELINSIEEEINNKEN